MKKKYIWALIILIIIVLVAIFSKKDSPQSQIGPTKVAVLLPLTGTFPWWGETIQNGIRVAEANGLTKDFEFIYKDTQCATKDAVSATQSIKSLDPSVHIFLVGCDSDLKAMLPILDKDKDIALVLGLSGADLYESEIPVVNLAYRLEAEAAAVANFASQKLNIKKIGVITGNNTFGIVLGKSIPEGIAKLGGSSVSEQILINDPHPETAVLKIVNQKPDAIYIHNDIPTIAAILKRLTQLGYKGPRIVTYAARDQSLIDAAGQAAEGMYVPWPISDKLSPKAQQFSDTYKKMFNKEAFVTSYFVYDGLTFLSEANKDCKGESKCIANYFFNNNFTGILGDMKFKRDGQVQRDFHFEQIKNGKFVEVSQ